MIEDFVKENQGFCHTRAQERTMIIYSYLCNMRSSLVDPPKSRLRGICVGDFRFRMGYGAHNVIRGLLETWLSPEAKHIAS